MQKILISACLLGQPVRYDGSSKAVANELLARWREEGRLVPVCPEIMAGLPTPRPPAEIAGGNDGSAALNGHTTISEDTGRDVTGLFRLGAEKTLETARERKCNFAILTDGSPSCGSSFIYDGSFSGTRIAGIGIVTALLRQNGISVFNENQIEEVRAHIEA